MLRPLYILILLLIGCQSGNSLQETIFEEQTYPDATYCEEFPWSDKVLNGHDHYATFDEHASYAEFLEAIRNSVEVRLFLEHKYWPVPSETNLAAINVARLQYDYLFNDDTLTEVQRHEGYYEVYMFMHEMSIQGIDFDEDAIEFSKTLWTHIEAPVMKAEINKRP